jgi:NAD(P)-dependent dehydrogenase (short-subunit alcohol dehydrogenase family)
MSFAGKVALVTGAGSGIGRETALGFARDGARVACADLNEDALDETIGFIRQSGGEGIAITADLSTHGACEMVVAKTIESLGGLHHAFNNAGISGSFGERLWDIEAIQRTIAINLEAVMWGMKHQIAHMVANGGGTIVNTASIAGISGHVGTLDYTAAKHGVVGFTKAAAMMYGAQGVRINAVCPGLIETSMTLEGRSERPGAEAAMKRLSPITGQMGEPADIAEAVLWLSSPKSKFVYGVALPVDGGFSIN